MMHSLLLLWPLRVVHVNLPKGVRPIEWWWRTKLTFVSCIMPSGKWPVLVVVPGVEDSVKNSVSYFFFRLALIESIVSSSITQLGPATPKILTLLSFMASKNSNAGSCLREIPRTFWNTSCSWAYVASSWKLPLCVCRRSEWMSWACFLLFFVVSLVDSASLPMGWLPVR